MPTVLIVDDSLIDRELTGGLLARDGAWTIEFASDGADALARFETSLPDVVVTDLQMPNKNGLELTAALRKRYPHVPVILITAHGSESLAMEALNQGAASYVPKSQLADKLAGVVEQMLAMSRAERGDEQLLEYLASAESTYLLENDPALVAPLVDQAQRALEAIGLCDAATRVRVGVALEEALYNALYHGNLEITTEELDDARSDLVLGGAADPVAERREQPPYRDRKIFFQMNLSHTEARFTVRDEGGGFDPEAFSGDVAMGSLEGGRGRGLLLMRTFMNDVSYNDRGNEITLIKRRESE